MTTKNEFLSLKDKNQSFTNDVSHTDKSGQYSNLNLNQNSSTLIPVFFPNNPKNDKYCDSKVPDKYDGRGRSNARNKSAGLCSHTLNLNDKTEDEVKKRWKKDGLSDASSSTFFLHISAFENSKEVAALDILYGENFELKRNKTNINNLMTQNPFEFPRQQEEDKVTEPEVMGFRASQRLLDPNQPTSSNNAQGMVNLYESGTQGLSTQSSTNQHKFIDWCKSFVQEYERRFVNPEQEITEKAEKKFRESFLKFLEPNLADDGKRYKSMFKNLVSYSRREDKGDLFHKFMPALFTLMEKYDANKNHQVQLLSNFLKIFEVENLDSDLVCDLEILYKEEVGKLADGASNIREICRQTTILFNNEEITKKRSIKLYVWLSTLRTQGITNKKIFERLLDECSHKSINGVVGVIW
uniref:Uncharacterized protein n=1 Tax=Panagrolaimus sp. PS1159 TaxID=55785 RepID=A0AC35EWF2_9BILA